MPTPIPIRWTCQNPACQRNLRADEQNAGRTAPCPHCNTPNIVPMQTELESPPPTPPPVISRPVDKPIVKPQSSVPVRNVVPHINPSPNASIPDLLRQAESPRLQRRNSCSWLNSEKQDLNKIFLSQLNDSVIYSISRFRSLSGGQSVDKFSMNRAVIVIALVFAQSHDCGSD